MLHVPPGWNKINICIWQNLVSTSHVDAVGQIYQTNFNQAYSNYITACPQLIWKFSTRPELPSVAFKKASRLYISCKKTLCVSQLRNTKRARIPFKNLLKNSKSTEVCINGKENVRKYFCHLILTISWILIKRFCFSQNISSRLYFLLHVMHDIAEA